MLLSFMVETLQFCSCVCYTWWWQQLPK
jgi:hypothetical protein